MNILRISPVVVALVCALLFVIDLDSSMAQLAIPSHLGVEVSGGGSSVIFPEDEDYVDEFIDESAPPPNYRRPPNGRRIPPNGQNGRYPHPVDSFLQAIEPFFSGGDVPNNFFNPEPNFNIHHHHHQQHGIGGGNFYSPGLPPPLPPPPQIPQHGNRPGKRPQPPHKNPIKFPSDLPPTANTFHHPQRPLFANKHPFKKPTAHQQSGLFISAIFRRHSNEFSCDDKHLGNQDLFLYFTLAIFLYGGCGFPIHSGSRSRFLGAMRWKRKRYNTDATRLSIQSEWLSFCCCTGGVHMSSCRADEKRCVWRKLVRLLLRFSDCVSYFFFLIFFLRSDGFPSSLKKKEEEEKYARYMWFHFMHACTSSVDFS